MSPVATWMEVENIIFREFRKRKTNIWYHLHVESWKKNTNEFTYEIETHSVIEKKLMVTKAER